MDFTGYDRIVRAAKILTDASTRKGGSTGSPQAGSSQRLHWSLRASQSSLRKGNAGNPSLLYSVFTYYLPIIDE